MFLQFETPNLLQCNKNAGTISNMRAFLHAPFVSSTLRKGGFAPDRKARGIFFGPLSSGANHIESGRHALPTACHVQTPQARRLPQENPERQGL
jgi:hypothetical protein